jgi:hypothetical protein
VQQVCTAGMLPIVDILTVNLMRWDVRSFCTIATDRTIQCHSKEYGSACICDHEDRSRTTDTVNLILTLKMSAVMNESI